METALAPHYRDTTQGREADAILRACVHCGFCTATCPTYQLLGDELDGPRGRIYLIKQMLEGREVSRLTQQHLDRCLTCTACETTCPSGVRYHRLLDIGRGIVEQRIPRSWGERIKRRWLREVVPYPQRFAMMLGLARLVAPLLPRALAKKIPPRQHSKGRSQSAHQRKMLILEGCVQSVATPKTNDSLVEVLNGLGISAVSEPEAGCCGALDFHMADHQAGLAAAKRNIDAWWPHAESGVEAIVISASGCGAMVKEYGYLLRDDAQYAEKAARISDLTRDVSEVLGKEDLSHLSHRGEGRKVAFHAPCTLQHSQQLPSSVQRVLESVGFRLTPIADAHLCCGSAGTYSVLQEEISQKLLINKLAALECEKPEMIVTANVGCQLHLQTQASVPVKHWIELLDAQS